MPRPVSEYPDDVTVYLVVNDYGQHGRAFVKTDIAEADRQTVLRNFLSGQYSNALRVIAFNTAEGWSPDVSEDIADELLQRAAAQCVAAAVPHTACSRARCRRGIPDMTADRQARLDLVLV
jgi:hypothetical protein